MNMMTLVYWHRAPDVRTLHHSLHHLRHELFRRGLRQAQAWRQGFWTPAVDLSEDEQGFTITAELAGFSKDDIQVELKDNRLTLKGERKRDSDVREQQYHRVERAYGAFTRSIKLPAEVDAEKATAAFKEGVLKLTLPKAEEAKPKPISITA
jgi:HSP20 family protein